MMGLLASIEPSRILVIHNALSDGDLANTAGAWVQQLSRIYFGGLLGRAGRALVVRDMQIEGLRSPGLAGGRRLPTCRVLSAFGV
jgi:hypothetical protein